MSVVVVVTAFPVPEHRAEVVAAFEEAIVRVHDEPGVELYALHERPDRLVMIEKYESAERRAEHLRGAPLARPAVGFAGQAQQRSRRVGEPGQVTNHYGKQALTGKRKSLSSLLMVSRDLTRVLHDQYPTESETQQYMEQLREMSEQSLSPFRITP